MFESNWWASTQPTYRRAVLMVIQRAQKSVKLQAGGMYALNLESFTLVNLPIYQSDSFSITTIPTFLSKLISKVFLMIIIPLSLSICISMICQC